MIPQFRINEAKQVIKIGLLSRQPVLIMGAPGIGKSDIVEQVRAELDYDMILTHPVVCDPTDAKGLPASFTNDFGQQQADFIPYGDLYYAMHATKPTIWFLDDLGQAPPAVQASFMQLLLAREVNGKRISDHVLFIAATNGRKHRAGVSGILEPVKSRFGLIFELIPHIDDLAPHLYATNCYSKIPAYLRFQPDAILEMKDTPDFEATPCPRTWSKLGKVLTALQDTMPDLRQRIVASSIGEARSLSYCAFEQLFGRLPDPEEVIKHPKSFIVPSEPDILYALCSSVATRTTTKNVASIAAIADRLPIQFSAMLQNDARAVCPDIDLTEAFGIWSEKITHAFIQ